MLEPWPQLASAEIRHPTKWSVNGNMYFLVLLLFLGNEDLQMIITSP